MNMAAKLFKTKNMSVDSRKKQARILRIFRKIHKTLGIFLFVFFIFISLTGFLLGLKKHSNGFLLPETKNGSTSDFKEWLSMDSLYIIAKSLNNSGKIDRIDVRKDKGIVKFVFSDNYLEIQLDGKTGNLLSKQVRKSDFLEKIHDGSILDYYLGIKSEMVKVFYTAILGLALFTFSITGFWLWYGPKLMRKH